MPAQSEILKLLGADVGLRTLKRDLQKLRGNVPKGTRLKPKGPHLKGAGGVNRSETGSNTHMQIEKLERRLDRIESVQLQLIDFLSKVTDYAAASRKNEMILLDITNRAQAEHASLHARCEQMHDIFTAAVRAAHHADHTHH